MLVAVDGGDAADNAFDVVGQLSTFKVNPNNTTTAIEQITARSVKYDVTFTFNVTQQTYLADGAPGLAAEKVAQVNYICSLEHVQGVRGEEDQGRDGNLYNYLVVTVGTDDGERSSEIRIRMDQLGSAPVSNMINGAWDLLTKLSPA